MELQVRLETKYGKNLYYPTNEAASLLAALTKQKTLTLRDLDLAIKLGHVVQIHEPYQIVLRGMNPKT